MNFKDCIQVELNPHVSDYVDIKPHSEIVRLTSKLVIPPQARMAVVKTCRKATVCISAGNTVTKQFLCFLHPEYLRENIAFYFVLTPIV